jgi:uncharacterized membrane protein YagU involved in acid resistance
VLVRGTGWDGAGGWVGGLQLHLLGAGGSGFQAAGLGWEDGVMENSVQPEVRKMGNTILSVLILIVSLVLAFGLCILAEKVAVWMGISPAALVPAAIVTVVLYPILRKG